MSKLGMIYLTAGSRRREEKTSVQCDSLNFDETAAPVSVSMIETADLENPRVWLRVHQIGKKNPDIGSFEISIGLLVELTTEALLRTNYQLSQSESKRLLLAIASTIGNKTHEISGQPL